MHTALSLYSLLLLKPDSADLGGTSYVEGSLSVTWPAVARRHATWRTPAAALPRSRRADQAVDRQLLATPVEGCLPLPATSEVFAAVEVQRLGPSAESAAQIALRISVATLYLARHVTQCSPPKLSCSKSKYCL
jgi:hypothetical protein